MKNYNLLKNQTYKKYKKIRSVYCPYLKTRVRFSSLGFWHMIYRSRNKKRSVSTQLLRFRLIDKAVELLKHTTTLQEYQKVENIEYFGFIAILEGWKIKVIVERKGRGKPHFLSVIPNWITNNKRDRLLHKGHLNED